MSIDCFCDYEPAEFYNSRIVRAKKPHRCEECGGQIISGESYEYVVAKWDGWFDTMKTCERCRDLRVWVKNNVPCFCWAHGNMIDDAAEAIDEACFRAPEETAGLRFGFLRRKVMLHKYNQWARANGLAAEDKKEPGK